MLKLKKIKIDGFKNLTNVCLNLSQLTALLSKNNYGKTNLLSGIQLGFKLIKQSYINVLQILCDEFNMPLNKNCLHKNFSFSVEFDVENDTLFDSLIYSYEYTYGSIESSFIPQVLSETLEVRQKDSTKYIKLIDRNLTESLYRPTLDGRCSKKSYISPHVLLINKLMMFDELFFSMIINDLIFFKIIYIDNGNTYYNNLLLNNNTSSNVNRTTDSLALLLFKIKSSNSNVYEAIINTMINLFPEVKYINVTGLNSNQKIIDKNNPLQKGEPYTATIDVATKYLTYNLNIDHMSDGFKKTLNLLTNLLSNINSQTNALYLIEEPEDSIHPSLLHSLIENIKYHLNNNQLILTSHSPFLVNYLTLDEIYIGTNNNGLAKFSRFKSKYYKKIQREAFDMEQNIGEYIFELLSNETEFNIDKLSDLLED